MSYVNKGINPITFSGLNIAVTSDESRAINFIDTPKIIISASGMCGGGQNKTPPQSTICGNLKTPYFLWAIRL